MQSATHKKIGYFLGTIIVLVGVFFLGAYSGTSNSISNAQSSSREGKDLNQFWRVWDIMESEYPFSEKEPDDKNKIYGAIEGLVDSYDDPYTVFFPPKEAQLFNDQVRGSFGGVGMEVGIKNNTIIVVAPLKDSPAEKAGIQAGDAIVSVDGKKTNDMDIDTVISLIRGEKGTKVTLELGREGETAEIPVTITRDTISLPVLETEVKGDVFVINFYNFSENSAFLFQEALNKFAASGQKKLIVDLRNNPGGYLDDAIEIASFFLPKDTVVLRENTGEGSPEIVHTSKGYSLLPKDTQTLILINHGSASASEILAGALTEHGVAKTLGTTSFGKGSVQQLINLPDKSSLKITVAKWFTPKGVSISEKGITPMIVVDEKPVQDPKTKEWSDPQMVAALKLLK